MVKTDSELLRSLPCPPCFLMSVVGAFLVLRLAFGILKITSLLFNCPSWDLHELIVWCKVEKDMPNSCLWRPAFFESAHLYVVSTRRKNFSPWGSRVGIDGDQFYFLIQQVHVASRTYMPGPCLDLSETGWLCLSEVSKQSFKWCLCVLAAPEWMWWAAAAVEFCSVAHL